jgi:fatty-acid peroxygenase
MTHIERIRANPESAPEGSAARVVALYRDREGALLDVHAAAVDLLSVLRPTVAVSVFCAFVAHALHMHPETGEAIIHDDAAAERFAQEVRRMYPFFPAVVARVREDFEYEGCPFRKGQRVLLDLYGTNHDTRVWKNRRSRAAVSLSIKSSSMCD